MKVDAIQFHPLFIWQSLECKVPLCSAKDGAKPLTAIWLDTPIMTATGITKKIEEGQQVFIESGKLKDCMNKPTHQITGCHGSPTGDFSITIIDLKTQELSKISI